MHTLCLHTHNLLFGCGKVR